MDDIAVQLWVGMLIIVIGFFVGYLVGLANWPDEGAGMIETCRRQHNVYECQIQAVPVAQPSWVSNGESK